MNLNNFIKGLSVLQVYYEDPYGHHLGAEHDIIYIYPTEKPLPEEVLGQLCGLGFFQPEVVCEGDFCPQDYDPSESWAVHV